jgi:hypothetical protein
VRSLGVSAGNLTSDALRHRPLVQGDRSNTEQATGDTRDF